MEENGKKRSPNFSTKEEAILISLLKKYATVIECKVTDHKANYEKTATWKKIQDEFNSISGETYRNHNYADQKLCVRGTGGGPYTDIKCSQLDEDIKQILGARIEGEMSQFDGDQGHSDENEVDSFSPELVPVSNGLIIEEITIASDNDHSYYVSNTQELDEKEVKEKEKENEPPLEQQVTNISIATRKRNMYKSESTVSSRVEQWAEGKTAMESAKARFLEEEQMLKLNLLREKHELEMSNMKRKADTEIEMMKEEHQAKIKMIKIQTLLLQHKKKV
ncbi:hypothetical protein NQ314_000252 [Rhamnusium bicolor]|uniref:Regulatory protein zeste n=1 Tax=Rhamnusium bicolor TaxID=1586634 RepID=A0AAV8ZVX8_9CUCU|nr:hypothetical protein NQ314_000252 [Rhamnusium bicolor]